MTLASQTAKPFLAEKPEARGVPALETERLMLRAPRRGDVKAIVRLVNDRHVAENTARIPYPYGVDDAERFIAAINRQDGEATFAIACGGELIGVCGVEPRENAPEVGYWIGRPFWGRGYATEAVRAVIDHAFAVLGHDALQAGARVSNPASRRVLEKCGFQWTGVGLYRIRAINSSAPLDRFRLDRGLWASLKAWGRAREVA
ncbi:MAG TPA: GNAT family N-acetyltransferase [Xanthobacteraceae bacterium]|nr:GNAT family N-acetyltransferase [Xanthobacteraceae bacterium]